MMAATMFTTVDPLQYEMASKTCSTSSARLIGTMMGWLLFKESYYSNARFTIWSRKRDEGWYQALGGPEGVRGVLLPNLVVGKQCIHCEVLLQMKREADCC